MEFIVDFQGFKDYNNDFIIKEMALASVDKTIYEHHLFQAPFSFNRLSDWQKKQAVWLEKNHHGLNWNSGDKDIREAGEIFGVVKPGSKIFVKGEEKRSYLERQITDSSVDVINLEKWGCPNLVVLKFQEGGTDEEMCQYMHKGKACVARNVEFLIKWLSEHRDDSGADGSEEDYI